MNRDRKAKVDVYFLIDFEEGWSLRQCTMLIELNGLSLLDESIKKSYSIFVGDIVANSAKFNTA